MITTTLTEQIMTIAVVVLGTMTTRFLPFILFPAHKKPPRYITYLGTVLPFAVIGLLVVFSLKNTAWTSGVYGAPELISIGIVILLHIWKRNMLVSIAGGTALYMLLVQFVFKG